MFVDTCVGVDVCVHYDLICTSTTVLFGWAWLTDLLICLVVHLWSGDTPILLPIQLRTELLLESGCGIQDSWICRFMSPVLL